MERLSDRVRDASYRLREARLALLDRTALSDGARRRLARVGIFVLPPLLLAGGVVAFLVLRPTPRPDFEFDRISHVFDYTLLEDDFNDLPIEERLELIGQLARRMEDMDQSDSAMMAAFAAGIAGSAREQLEKNMSRVMIDLMDKYASDYDDVPHEDREAFLDEKIVELDRLGEQMSGRTSDRTDAERLAEARRQAERDLEYFRNAERGPSGRQVGVVFGFMTQHVGTHATPQQRARVSLLMRDMARHLRGQDIRTGEGPG